MYYENSQMDIERLAKRNRKRRERMEEVSGKRRVRTVKRRERKESMILRFMTMYSFMVTMYLR